MTNFKSEARVILSSQILQGLLHVRRNTKHSESIPLNIKEIQSFKTHVRLIDLPSVTLTYNAFSLFHNKTPFPFDGLRITWAEGKGNTL